jgi:hypothetical protein
MERGWDLDADAGDEHADDERAQHVLLQIDLHLRLAPIEQKAQRTRAPRQRWEGAVQERQCGPQK